MLQRQASKGSLAPERLASRFGTLQDAVTRMAAQVGELSELAHGESGVDLKLTALDLVSVVREAVTLVRLLPRRT